MVNNYLWEFRNEINGLGADGGYQHSLIIHGVNTFGQLQQGFRLLDHACARVEHHITVDNSTTFFM